MPVPDFFVGRWVGDLNGTLVGPLFVEFLKAEQRFQVLWRANIRGQLVMLEGELQEADGAIGVSLVMAAQQQALPAPAGDAEGAPSAAASDANVNRTYAEVHFEQYSPTRLAGQWTAIDGNKGVFQLAAANTGRSVDTTQPFEPLQIVNRQEDIPKLRLARGDLVDLIAAVKRAIPTPNDVVVAVNIDGNEVVQLSADFLARPDLPMWLSFIRLSLSDQSPGIRKSIQITLSDQGSNFHVSASDDVWVNGVATALRQSIRRRSSWYGWWFQRHGLNINGIALLTAVGVSPNLALTPRLVFLGAVVVALLGFKAFHGWISRVRVWPRTDTPDRRGIALPEILTTALGGIGTLMAVGLFSFLAEDGLQKVGQWIANALGQ